MRSKIMSLMVTVMVLCTPMPCFAQAQEVLEEHTGFQRKIPSTSAAEVRKAFWVIFDTKEFQEKKPFAEFTTKLAIAVSKKGKEVQIVIDRDAFQKDNKDPELLDIREEEVVMPTVHKVVARTALLLALSQVGNGRATYWVRRGQMVVTSNERATSSHFLKTSDVIANSEDRRLVDLLDEFAEETGVSIIIDVRVQKQAQTKITAKCGGKLETVVRLLSKSAGLEPVVLKNVIYVTSPANARTFNVKPDDHFGGHISGAVHKNSTLTRAIDELVDGVSTSISGGNWSGWVLDSNVKNKANVRITAKWQNYVEPDVALRVLTDMAGLRYVVMDDVAYITSPANAKKLEEEQARKKPARD